MNIDVFIPTPWIGFLECKTPLPPFLSSEWSHHFPHSDTHNVLLQKNHPQGVQFTYHPLPAHHSMCCPILKGLHVDRSFSVCIFLFISSLSSLSVRGCRDSKSSAAFQKWDKDGRVDTRVWIRFLRYLLDENLCKLRMRDRQKRISRGNWILRGIKLVLSLLEKKVGDLLMR